MKTCNKCGNEFEPSKGLVSYCSLKCRNSRERSDDIKKKISDSLLVSQKAKEAHENRDWNSISAKYNETIKARLLAEDFNKLKFERIKLRVLYEQDEKCNRCGISEWLGQKITLELEHKDGNHFNNDRQNLEILCPNCHALTDTWRGRNKRVKAERISDETLFNALVENKWNMRQSLIQVGLAPKGGNYNRCHKLKKEYDNMHL
jgi:hypothetical protein